MPLSSRTSPAAAVTTIAIPERSGSRELARDLLRPLPEDMSQGRVELDFEGVFLATPSFVDELIKVLLVERAALNLSIRNCTERAAQHVRRSSMNRQVSSRVSFANGESSEID